MHSRSPLNKPVFSNAISQHNSVQTPLRTKHSKTITFVPNQTSELEKLKIIKRLFRKKSDIKNSLNPEEFSQDGTNLQEIKNLDRWINNLETTKGSLSYFKMIVYIFFKMVLLF